MPTTKRREGIGLRLRFKILQRCDFACVYCGSKDRLEVDHVFPVALGGTNAEKNLVAACFSCNRGKAATSAERLPFGRWLITQQGTDGWIADLARDVIPGEFDEATTLAHVREGLEQAGAFRYCSRKHRFNLLRLVWHALRGWRRGRPTTLTRKTMKRDRDNRAEIQRRVQWWNDNPNGDSDAYHRLFFSQ